MIDKVTPFFSIIIPVYNAYSTLKYCSDSILSQTFNDFEVILVDDGSIDQSPELCDQLSQQDNRIKVIHKKMEVFLQLEMLE